VVKGTSNGTQTDFDGFFSLNVEQGQTLVVSYIGFQNTELPIYSSVMNISLEEDSNQLQEVVVMGLGVEKEKHALGFAVSSVGAEDVSRTVSGRVAGINIRGSSSYNGIVLITTKKSTTKDDITSTKFVIKKPYSIPSDGDITSIEINSFELNAKYEYFAAPIINENVFLTTTFSNWEQYNLLPGEASVYFKGTYAGKTTLNPYTTKKEMTVSLGMDQNITVSRKQNKNFKSKSFTGSNRILERTYDLEVKNNKAVAIDIKLMDRIPISQNKDIKVHDIVTNTAAYDAKKGLLSWVLKLAPHEVKTERFSFRVKYPKYKRISI